MDNGAEDDGDGEAPKEVTQLDYHVSFNFVYSAYQSLVYSFLGLPKDFKSFTEGRMKSALESIKATGEDN